MPKILLVEDNEMNRDMLSRRLRRKGYRVVLAVDGPSGVEMAQTQAPDLVLMDMSLPVLDGWEATRRLKADARQSTFPSSPSRRTPCPATAKKPSKPAATTTTADTKPVELPRLLGKIEALLSGGEMASTGKPHRDRTATPNPRRGPACAAIGSDPRPAHATQSDHRIL